MGFQIIRCPGCESQLRLPDTLAAGSQGQCPKCSATFVIPETGGAAPHSAAASPSAYSELPPPPDPYPPADFTREQPRGGSDFAFDDSATLPRQLQGLSSDYRIDLGEWFRYAFAHYTDVLGPMIGYFFVYLAISFAMQCVPYLGGFISLLMDPALHAGFTVVALAQLQGKRWSFGDFFAGFNYFGSLFGNRLVTNLLLLLCMVPSVFIWIVLHNERDEAALAVMVGVVIVNVLVALYLGVRISFFAVPLILDRQCGALEAIQGSWLLSRGHFWGLLGVGLVELLITLAGVAALLVGMLFALPLTTLMTTAGYLLVAGRRPPIDNPQPTYPHVPY